MTKGRSTTLEERIEIVKCCTENEKNYIKSTPEIIFENILNRDFNTDNIN
ncbi:hypothetical protein GOQ29_13910 [Clostridium sp. D2Q-14]|nr:hypothetical protein [Anaeromonas gelatinilytica]MBS4536714.1 hypothetical protein [Anaeromonas gelatinilytica]